MDDNFSRENESSFLGQKEDSDSIIVIKKEDDIDDFGHQLKFEENEIKLDLNIKKAKYFSIENIIIINISQNKSFDTLYMVIDENNENTSSENLLFTHDIIVSKNPTIYRITPMGEPLLKGERLINSPSFYIKNPKIGEYTINIYLREKPNGDNLSTPLKITVNLIEDRENIERKEEKEKKIILKEKKTIKEYKKKIKKLIIKVWIKLKLKKCFMI
jgi:hypothetical protein